MLKARSKLTISNYVYTRDNRAVDIDFCCAVRVDKMPCHTSNMYMSMYMHVYVCVCVCGCVSRSTEYARRYARHLPEWGGASKDRLELKKGLNDGFGVLLTDIVSSSGPLSDKSSNSSNNSSISISPPLTEDMNGWGGFLIHKHCSSILTIR